MRKHLYLLTLLLALTLGASAQKFALVDMQYILKNIPNYEMMNEQLETVSKRWQQEVKTLQDKAETLYKKYQSDLVFLTAEQKRQREEEIGPRASSSSVALRWLSRYRTRYGKQSRRSPLRVDSS